MESLLVWGLGLLALALVLLVAEFFVPSAGTLGLTAAVIAITGVVCLFRYDTLWGVIGSLIVIVFGPLAVYFGLKLWPHTPLGRRVIGAPSDEEAAATRQRESDEKKKQAALVGKEGRVLTDLRPVGTVEIDGVRYDALSETLFVPAGSRVRVVGAEVAQIKVREMK